MNERAALILLNSVPSLPTARFKKLIEVFGTAVAALKARRHDLVALGGLTPFMAGHVERAKETFDPGRELERARHQGIKILIQADEDYPENLKEIFDPPQVLYVKGCLDRADKNAVAIVGSRGASYYGLTCAGKFSERLSSWGLTVVSGMARGIDTAAHRACLGAGGRTIAVLGSGLDVVYPPENEALFAEIGEKGAVMSEFPLGTQPFAQNFPRRNRIVSGLSRGVLVVEATQMSGALITARLAAEQGRDVFAIPGKVSSATSSGTNDLIKDGGRMVTEPEEILNELKSVLSLERSSSRSLKDSGLVRCCSADEARVLACLDDEPKHVDKISQELKCPVAEVLALLVPLELRRMVRSLPGKMYVKK